MIMNMSVCICIFYKYCGKMQASKPPRQLCASRKFSSLCANSKCCSLLTTISETTLEQCSQINQTLLRNIYMFLAYCTPAP